MAVDFTRILASKKALRRRLSTQPLEEKLEMLDRLRDRMLALRNAGSERGLGNRVADTSARYHTGSEPRT